ncbi:hypothetical protein [Amaricoccus sp.]|uniref:hypothetical protein n=1 Tax=Amaricoccus sp. TaxID=1872485 RepID=UPI001B4EC855|nr:hypothetical protein [Amaricoccus sp.]MBP7003226.1 hypothetical protein [Amaricoccus sp.]
MHRPALAVACLALAGAAQAQTPALPAPIAAFAAERSAECAAMGGTPRVGPAFATPVDLTGDGTPDYVVDLAGIECANAWSAFCGSAGCPVSVWIAGAEGLRQEWSDYAQGWSIDAVGSEVGLMLDRHGGDCPGSASGAETCRERKVFTAPPAPTPVDPAATEEAAPTATAEPSPAAAAAALAAPVAEGWSLRRAADGAEVAVTAAPGALSTIAIFCLSGQPWLAASLDAPFPAATAQIEFVFSGGSASSTARREDGAGGALVIELADRPLVGLLSGRDSSARVKLDGEEQGVLSLRGSTKAIRAALAACTR